MKGKANSLLDAKQGNVFNKFRSYLFGQDSITGTEQNCPFFCVIASHVPSLRHTTELNHNLKKKSVFLHSALHPETGKKWM